MTDWNEPHTIGFGFIVNPGPCKALVFVALSLVLAGCAIRQLQPDIKEGGRAVAIAVHPSDAKKMLVASESGGLFLTEDGGQNWSHVSGLRIFAMSDVAYAPGDPKVVIATTRADFRAKINPIWRSVDGGSTWSAPPTASPVAGPRCTSRPNAWGVSFEPGSTRVFVGTDCGLAVSDDLGASWSHVVLDASVAAGVDRRQNAVWSVLAQSGGKVVVAAADGLWYSNDAAIAWNKSQIGPSAGQPGVTHAFAASPLNPDHILHAGKPSATGEEAAIHFTTNGGIFWVKTWPITDWGRPVFVRGGGAVQGTFDFYVGNGVKLFRRTYTSSAAGLVGSGSWMELAVDHADPCDVGFDSAGAPVLLATDGGVHTTVDKGKTWKLVGGGKGGFNALQVYQVTGQEVSGSSPHQDLYFGTQDNNIWASSDGGSTWPSSTTAEGNLIRTAPQSVDHANTKVTGVRCAGCVNFVADAHLANVGNWPNPTDSAGAPYPLPQPGHYIQNTVSKSGPTGNAFRLTKDFGANWSTSPLFTLTDDLVGPPAVVGPASNPTIYQAVRRPGATLNGFQRIGLVRVTNIYGPGAIAIDAADASGTISLGQYSSMFFWGAVFGVDPGNTNDILAADVEGSVHAMKRSTDGGQTWAIDNDLTSQVTDGGVFAFQIDEPVPAPKAALLVVRQIAFDPITGCHILVGTRGNGVIRSADGGQAWSRIKEKTLFGYVDDSRIIGDVSSLYFPPHEGDLIWVSSYGRGLWGLSVDRSIKTCPKPKVVKISKEQLQRAELHDLKRATRDPFDGLARPLVCRTCKLLLAKDGQITDVELERSIVRKVSISGGSVHQFDSQARPIPLEVPNDYRSGLGQFSADRRLAEIAAQGVPLRGLLIEDGVLVGVITALAELPGVPGRSPYVRIDADQGSGVALKLGGGCVIVSGEGFVPAGEGASGLEVRLDEELVARNPAVDKDGRFRVVIEVTRPSGEYRISAEQRAGLRFLRDATTLQIAIRDEAQ